jgi:hypothetical protein
MAVSKRHIKRRKVIQERNKKVREEVDRLVFPYKMENKLLRARIDVLERKLGQEKINETKIEVEQALEEVFPDAEIREQVKQDTKGNLG